MASLLDLLAPWLSQAQQTPDQVVSAKPQGGMNNLGIDPSMLQGMPQQGSYDQQLQDPNQWNLSGQAQVPDYSRITTPGNPGGPSYNANYGQTSYPGSATFGNPQGQLVPPAYRGLLMASSSYIPHARWQHGTGRENDTARELAPVPVSPSTSGTPVNGNATQMIQQMLQRYQQLHKADQPGPVRLPSEIL